MQRPTVSVLMTVYNRARYITEAIESVLASSYSDFELIIVDDGSTDASVEIARRYESQDPRIQVHVNPSNLGDYPNRNRAAALAAGRYLKYLDSDDMVYAHGLEVMVRSMEQFPTAGLGLCQYNAGYRPYPQQQTPYEAYKEHFLDECDLFGRAPGSAIIRRSVFEAVGGFSGKRDVGDHELWLRIAAEYPTVKMAAGLYWARVHGEQEHKVSDPRQRDAEHQAIDDAALSAAICPLSKEEVEQAYQKIKARTRRLAMLRTVHKTRRLLMS